MKRFFFTVAAVAIACLLIAGASLQAAPRGGGARAKAPAAKGGGMAKGASKAKAPLAKHTNQGKGQQAKNGNQGKGQRGRSYDRGYRGWSDYAYFPDYGSYGFHDSATQEWYYWSESSDVFLPVSDMEELPPETSGAALLPPGAERVLQK
jgi:hypothetical protein